MNHEVKEEGKFKYLEHGKGTKILMLLHGLFGGLSNFDSIINHFSDDYKIIVPILPIYDLPIRKVSVSGIVDFVDDFVAYKEYENINILGNSLGGHVAILFALKSQHKIASITLTGSSGLFEHTLGSTFPRRGDYDFITKKTEETFYDPKMATKELVDEVFNTVNDNSRAIRVIATAKSAVRHNLSDKLHQITVPTLLIWGKNDNVTPPFVGEKFNELISGSKLVVLDKCGHAPMMEAPDLFNEHLDEFLKTLS